MEEESRHVRMILSNEDEQKVEESKSVEDNLKQNDNGDDARETSELSGSNDCQKFTQSFNPYPDALPELRMMIIDELSTTDRVQLSSCSKLCWNEVKKSKNYIQRLELNFDEGRISEPVIIEVFLGDPKAFLLKFKRTDSTKYMTVETAGKIHAKIRLDDSIDLLEFGLRHFKNVLQYYQSKLRTLSIYGKCDKEQWKKYDFGIRNLKNLTCLIVAGRDIDAVQFLSIIRHPLEHLFLGEGLIISSDWEQFFKVYNHLHLTGVSFTFDQMLQICSEYVQISIGDLSVQDIGNYIEKQMAGGVNKHLTRFTWDLSHSNFDAISLFRMFGMEQVRPGASVKIKRKNSSSRAFLRYFRTLIVFEPSLELNTTRRSEERVEGHEERDQDA